MYKNRLIPKLLITKNIKSNKNILVTSIQFNDYISIGDPFSQTKIFDAQSADELIILNIDNEIDINSNFQLLKKITGEIFVPVTYGGGINSLDLVREYLKNGADKISINTEALKNPSLISKISEYFGKSTVCVSIDYKKNKNNMYKVFVNRGNEEVNINPIEWAIEAERRGAGEIVLCNMDRDGSKNGLDLTITKKISNLLRIPVITSGGCGNIGDFVDGYKMGKASAVSASTYFCFKDQGFMQVRSSLKNAGISIRTST